jgi:hypothetical protein
MPCAPVKNESTYCFAHEEVKKHHNNDTAKRSKNKTFIKTLLHTRNGVSISSGRCHRPKAQVQLEGFSVVSYSRALAAFHRRKANTHPKTKKEREIARGKQKNAMLSCKCHSQTGIKKSSHLPFSQSNQ